MKTLTPISPTIFYLFYNIFIICLLLIQPIIAQQAQIANYPEIPTIKSGDHKLVTSRLSTGNTINLTQPLNVTFMARPIIAIGFLIFQVQAGANLGFVVQVGNITFSSFDSKISVFVDTNINQLFYTYVAVEGDGRFGFLPLVVLVPLIAGQPIVNNSIAHFSVPINQTLNLQKKYLIQTYIKDFTLKRTSTNDYSIRVEAQILSGSATEFNLTLYSNCTVSAVSFYIFWIDRTTFQANHTYFLDPGYGISEYSGTKTDQIFDVTPNQFNYYNFLRGANWLAFNTTNQTLYSIAFNAFPWPTYTKYKYARANLLHWRKRQCSNINYSLYLQQQLKCYDTCPSGYANNFVLKYCQKCDYTCQECQTNGVTCLNCPVNSFRVLSNGACICENGYFTVVGDPVCVACDYSCFSCEGRKDNCTACDSTRTLSSGSCLCKDKLFDNQTNNPICAACHYTCLKCTSSSTTCIDCNATANRILVITSCLCKSGYSQSSVPSQQQCIQNPNLVCQAPCLTCQNSPNFCTGCSIDHKRQLGSSSNSNRCVCKQGYQSVNNVLICTQICGDGIKIEYQCDDGNTIDGDGCSSGCRIQDNFSCNATVGQISQCRYLFQYAIKLVSIIKRPDSNLADLQFLITPAPPQNSLAQIANIPNKIISQSLFSTRLTLTLEYTQTIPLTTQAQLSLSTIPNKLEFQVKSDNNLPFTYHTSSGYSLATAQNVLVWILIGMSWILGLACLILYKEGLLIVFQYFVWVGMCWLGVGVMKEHELFFIALGQFRYIFGYNYQVPNQDGLFSILNYSLILLILPTLILLLAQILSKKAQIQFLTLPQKTKRYILIQLTTCCYLFTTVLLLYGLCTQSYYYPNSVGTALSISSIIFGVLYLIGVCLIGIVFWRKAQFFEIIKVGFVGRKGQIYFLTSLYSKYISIIIFCILSNQFPTNQYFSFIIVSISSLLIALTIKLRPYENNLRILLNQIALILVYLCYFLIMELRNAQWSGFAVLVVMYVVFGGSCVVIGKGFYRVWKYKVEEQGDKVDEENLKNNGSKRMDANREEYQSSHQKQLSNQYQQNYYANQESRLRNNLRIDMDFDPRINKSSKIHDRQQIDHNTQQAQHNQYNHYNKYSQNDQQNPMNARFNTIKKQPEYQLTSGGGNSQLPSYRKKILDQNVS